MISQNQFDLLEQQQNNNMCRNCTGHSEETENVMFQFPIETDESLNQLEVALADNNYRKKMVCNKN